MFIRSFFLHCKAAQNSVIVFGISRYRGPCKTRSRPLSIHVIAAHTNVLFPCNDLLLIPHRQFSSSERNACRSSHCSYCNGWNSALRNWHSQAGSQGRILLNAHDTILTSSCLPLPAQTVSSQEPDSKNWSPRGVAPQYISTAYKCRHCDQQIRSVGLNPNVRPRQGTLGPHESHRSWSATWPPLSPGDRQRDPHPLSKISATEQILPPGWLR